MPSEHNSRQAKKPASASPLMVRLDKESRTFLSEAAQLRKVSISDYVRAVTIAQARREVLASRQQTVALTPEEQQAFWEALNETPRLTPVQRRLGATMRGES